MAVASAGPYVSLHLAPDRQPCQHPTTQFFTGRMPFLPPNQQRQSTEVTESSLYSIEVKKVSGHIGHCLGSMNWMILLEWICGKMLELPAPSPYITDTNNVVRNYTEIEKFVPNVTHDNQPFDAVAATSRNALCWLHAGIFWLIIS